MHLAASLARSAGAAPTFFISETRRNAFGFFVLSRVAAANVFSFFLFFQVHFHSTAALLTAAAAAAKQQFSTEHLLVRGSNVMVTIFDEFAYFRI
jgi:hypothetical protein